TEAGGNCKCMPPGGGGAQPTNTPVPTATTQPGSPTNTPGATSPPPAATATPNPACVSNPGSFEYGTCANVGQCESAGRSGVSCTGGKCVYTNPLKACPIGSSCASFWVPDGFSCEYS